MMMNKLATASVVLFIAACCLPCLEWQKAGQPNDIMFGGRALLLGWSGLFSGVYGWLANPFWVLALFFALIRKPTITSVLGAIALAIALTTFGVVGKELPGDEGGVTKTTIVRILPGCYVWLISMLSLAAAAILPGTR